MAASMCKEKLSKSERKALKKQNKSHHTLLKHDAIQTSKFATQHLLVGNGGLGNGVELCELQGIFNEYGEIVDLVMQPGKPYAFISYATADQAKTALIHVNARELKCPEELSRSGVKFYLNFVEKVPGVSIPTDSLPPGVTIVENIINEKEEEDLLKCIDWDYIDPNLSTENESSLKHRRVHHCGYEFMYSTNNVDPSHPLQEAIPTACDDVISKLLTAKYFTSLPDQLTVNQYQPGQGIPPHIDTHSAFEDSIVSISLGSQVVMDFRHPDGSHVAVLLPRRSALVMTGPARYMWSHGITPRKSDIIAIATESDHSKKDKLTLVKRETRTSFTFRRLRRGPCACSYPEQCDSQLGVAKKQTANTNSKKTAVNLPSSETEAARVEAQHVHQVYEEIAGHFSDTRHTAWPQVAQFLQQQPEGSLVADIGCGNGKYLAVSHNSYKIGCDRSYNLCGICAERGFPVFVCDALSVPLKSNAFDVAISIAVVHHLSTPERRCGAIAELVRVLRPGGQGLIYVWALEQERKKVKSNYLRESRVRKRQVHDHGKGQKELNATADDSQLAKEMENTYIDKNRQTTLSSEDQGSKDNEREEEVNKLDFNTKEGDKQEACSELSVHVNRTHFESQDLLVPWHLKSDQEKSDSKIETSGNENGGGQKTVVNQGSNVFHRYYHVFSEGELEDLCRQLPDVKVVKSYYDKGNWCVVLEKL